MANLKCVTIPTTSRGLTSDPEKLQTILATVKLSFGRYVKNRKW